MNLSKRAQTYLQSLERRAFIRDKGKVIHALEQSGILFEEWIWEIHRDFAGYVEKLYLDEAVYGIIHENPK